MVIRVQNDQYGIIFEDLIQKEIDNSFNNKQRNVIEFKDYKDLNHVLY